MAGTSLHPISLAEAEHPTVEQLEVMLRRDEGAALVSPTGERIDLPNTVYQVLKMVVTLMAHGQAVTVVPDNQVVTTQRAAEILGMSRPFLIKLLETGVISYFRVGNQRRIYLRDVLRYGQKRDEERRHALDQLSKTAVETGLYERNVFPKDGRDE